jgi:phosphoglycolate phosphatase-like HAD superfamily hydrolase
MTNLNGSDSVFGVFGGPPGRAPARPAGPGLLERVAAAASQPRPAEPASRSSTVPDGVLNTPPSPSCTPHGAPLPSWRATPQTQAIIAFVECVTKEGSASFVPKSERIAVFDSDGTLWVEQPLYAQAAFVVDRIKELTPQHADWKDRQPFKGVLEGGGRAIAATGEQGLAELIAATHTGSTTEEFAAIVTRWIDTARHPGLNRTYTELVYQPMLELLAYLHASEFKVFIIAGGSVEFMRPWVERVYGIPKERVVGSRARLTYEARAGHSALRRLAEVALVEDKAGKPAGIHQQIGQRPIAAFGNSDGDFELLEWTTLAPGRRLGVIIHHTDAEREWAYDRRSHVGPLARALEEAPARGWVVVDMKRDWAVIYPFQK